MLKTIFAKITKLIEAVDEYVGIAFFVGFLFFKPLAIGAGVILAVKAVLPLVEKLVDELIKAVIEK